MNLSANENPGYISIKEQVVLEWINIYPTFSHLYIIMSIFFLLHNYWLAGGILSIQRTSEINLMSYDVRQGELKMEKN